MAKGIISVKDKTGLVDSIIHELSQKGSVRLTHLGKFSVRLIKGGKRYDFRKRTVILKKPYKQIIFSPARGIREMLREDKMAASK